MNDNQMTMRAARRGPGLEPGVSRLRQGAAAVAAAILLSFAPEPAPAAPPKSIAPVDLVVSVLDPVEALRPVRIRLEATPRIDAPALRLTWLLPPDVLSDEGARPSWSGSVAAGETATLTVTVRLADLTHRVVIAGATLEHPSGARQVRAVTLDLPPGSLPKTSPGQPVVINSRGERLMEHEVAEPADR